MSEGKRRWGTGLRKFHFVGEAGPFVVEYLDEVPEPTTGR